LRRPKDLLPQRHRGHRERVFLGGACVALWCKSCGAGLFSRKPREKESEVSDNPTMVALGEDYPELREAVRKICERYPGAYWRKLEAEQAYPTEFITELTRGGFLASLIPEEYGGS